MSPHASIAATTVGDQHIDDTASEIIKETPRQSSRTLLKKIKQKQKGSLPLSRYTFQERAFLSERNNRMLQQKR